MKQAWQRISPYRGEPLRLDTHPWAVHSMVTGRVMHLWERSEDKVWAEIDRLYSLSGDWSQIYVTYNGRRVVRHATAPEPEAA